MPFLSPSHKHWGIKGNLVCIDLIDWHNAKTLVQACIASRLDYCNAVLHASLAIYYNGCSPSRMPRRGWSLAQVDVSISHPCYENYTGCQSDAVSSLINIATLVFKALNGLAPPVLHTWSTTATWSAMTFADYAQLSPSRVRYQGQGQGSVIDRSQSPAHESGTVCLLRCER